MKIIVIGATGTLGKAIVAELSARHEIVQAGKTSGHFQADIADIGQVCALLDTVGPVDAVVSAAGHVHFGPLAEMTPEKFAIGLRDKLMGQINLVLAAQERLAPGGSITLTSGVLSHAPVRGAANAATVNSGLEGFVRVAAVELMARGIRLNVVSPTITQETFPKSRATFVGFDPVPAARVALAYARSVEGPETGQEYRVW